MGGGGGGSRSSECKGLTVFFLGGGYLLRCVCL